MREVYVSEVSGGGIFYYVVMVDGAVFDTLPLLKMPPLTFSQQYDIAQGYSEYLNFSS